MIKLLTLLDIFRTDDHILLSQIRDLPQPGGPASSIYIPQDQCGPVIPSGTGFLSHHLLRFARLWWRYSSHLHTGMNRTKKYFPLVTSRCRPVENIFCHSSISVNVTSCLETAIVLLLD
jgi:hypothetical protein